MKIFLKILIPLMLISCTSKSIRISEFAKINQQNEYMNNYITYSEKSRDKKKFLNFFFNSIFNPPKKLKFPLEKINKNIYKNDVSLLTWGGHSTFLIQKNNINILIDPHFSLRASPFSFIGPKRYMPSVFKRDNLPRIDVVAISHNHYDHLDIKSLKTIYEKFPETIFLVPLGDKELLINNGITKVKEFDWWEDYKINNLKFIFTPVKHWSKRTLFDKNKSLWGGWWIENDNFKFLHLGDTGYSKDFIDIKNKLGKPDLAAIPIGAYRPQNIMKSNHLNPEEAIKTFIDLEAKLAVAMHWGTFVLSQEPVNEPKETIISKLRDFGISKDKFIILKHGETLPLN